MMLHKLVPTMVRRRERREDDTLREVLHKTGLNVNFRVPISRALGILHLYEETSAHDEPASIDLPRHDCGCRAAG